jgi:choline dehydrogenase-like flavoprotein
VTTPFAQHTDFTKDVLGRYVCNGLDEAIASISGVDGRPFDIVIIGGGSFGSALALHTLSRDRFRNHRILVLDAGPYVLSEHVQNLPGLGLLPPPPSTTDPGVARAEVWGLPWRSNVPIGFPGLAYCLGGRSMFWGGWSAELVEAETPPDAWPDRVLRELRLHSPVPGDEPYFRQAAEQMGVTQTNDFMFGAMHEALRQQIFDGIQAGAVPGAVPLADLPLHVDPIPEVVDKDLLKLEAPLAVQGGSPRSGPSSIDRFSAMPLLARAARQAQGESRGDDRRKRLMVVPNCHVTRLETVVEEGVGRVVAVHVGGGSSIPIPERGIVVLALGTIESTRLALLSFPGTAGYDLIGTNLLSHMRSNYTFRIPREALADLPADVADSETSALFIKGCRTHHATDGSVSHCHLQVTAAGRKGAASTSEAELRQAIPDADTVDNFLSAEDDHVVITLRGVGELQPHNPANRVSLSEDTDEFGVRRAFVSLGDPRDPAQPGETIQTTNDRDTWHAMDALADDVRAVIVGTSTGEDLARYRDGLGTTHHEAGTLWMGTDPAGSVTTPDARFHNVVNAYALGPALLPTIGSPGPMLSGVALARRLGDHLVAPPPAPDLEHGFVWLFDGSAASFGHWLQAGPGDMLLDEEEGLVTARPGHEIGLWFFGDRGFVDFVLRLQFRIDAQNDNTGVFVRFRDPCSLPPDHLDPRLSANPAWIAVHTGFEVQVDDFARDDGADCRRTGALYDIATTGGPVTQAFSRGSALQPGSWNDLEITVSGDSYAVRLNHHITSVYTNPDPTRGVSADQDPSSGFIGLQQHTGNVSFRAVRIREDAAPRPTRGRERPIRS